MTTAPDSGKAILERIAAREVERAKLEAATAADMLEFQDLRRSQAERHDDPRLRELEISFAADELGTVLHQPTKTVQDRLSQSRRVRNLMPLTWQAHQEGRIDSYRVSLIAAAAAKLTTNHNLIHLDHEASSYAASHTASQLKGKLKRFVARWETKEPTVKAERSKRSVWVSHQDDGMSYLNAYIPTADAVWIDAMLTERAKAVSDDRTFDQRRADEFIAQMRGAVDGHTVSSRAVIGILVPVTTLAGFDDQPGESFDGSYALPAEMVKDLANQPGTLFHRVMTDPLGRILDIDELGRFPSAKLGTAIDIRDGTCRFTTCTRPAIECDADHEIPHPRGPTNARNLRALCRRHHNMKTAGIVEPTDLIMRARTSSTMEADLARYAVQIQYAA